MSTIYDEKNIIWKLEKSFRNNKNIYYINLHIYLYTDVSTGTSVHKCQYSLPAHEITACLDKYSMHTFFMYIYNETDPLSVLQTELNNTQNFKLIHDSSNL